MSLSYATAAIDFSDTWKNGLTILVYANGREEEKRSKVHRICRDLAIAAWDDRHRYVERLAQIKSLEEATAMAKAVGDDSSLKPLLFADIADNPGGGARSNTTFVLKAFLDAGVTGAVFGHFYDIAAVKKCHEVRPLVTHCRDKHSFQRLLSLALLRAH